MHNQQHLNNYFANHWNAQIDQYKYSGLTLKQKVRLGESVLDVGCGPNPFKGHIANLTGIDPAFDQADYKCTIEEFESNVTFDVAFCLGSINFGTEETVLTQIKCVVNLLKPHGRIYWRCNPGRRDHGNSECEAIDFFPWTKQLHKKYAEQFDFELVDIQDDNNNRIYAEWRKA